MLFADILHASLFARRYAIMGTQSIQEIVAGVNSGGVVNGVVADPAVGIPATTIMARAA